MKPVQCEKAVEACFHLLELPTSKNPDGAVTVPTKPGGSKKPHQKKSCCNEHTTILKQRDRKNPLL